ncbi:hypothetical protein V8F33_002803 [Rhypophila sp. PSN 637]
MGFHILAGLSVFYFLCYDMMTSFYGVRGGKWITGSRGGIGLDGKQTNGNHNRRAVWPSKPGESAPNINTVAAKEKQRHGIQAILDPAYSKTTIGWQTSDPFSYLDTSAFTYTHCISRGLCPFLEATWHFEISPVFENSGGRAERLFCCVYQAGVRVSRAGSGSKHYRNRPLVLILIHPMFTRTRTMSL